VAVTTSTKEEQEEQFTILKTGRESIVDVLSFLSELEEDIKQILKGSLSLRDGGQFQQLTATDIRRALFARARARAGVPLCIRNILLESVISTEKYSGFAGLIAVMACIHLVKHKMNALLVGNTQMVINIEEDIANISNLSRRTSKDIAFRSIRKYIGNPLASSIVLQACDMTGHNGQLYIDKDYTSSTSIELTNGYTFPLCLEQNFAVSTKTEEWKEFSVKVLIIDGIIESIGEINRILEYFHDEKRPGIIFARGFNDEVLGTLSVNKSRETLNVVPVIVPYDLAGINTLVDIAVVANSDVVSSLKGDIISGIDPSEIVTVDKVIVNNNSVIISNEKSSDRVRRHINNILEQKNETNVNDKKDLLDKRTKALSSVCTNIKLANNLDNKDAIYLQVQHGINLLKHICRYGTIDSRKALERSNNVGLNNVLQSLIDNGYHDLSAKELILGLKIGTSLANSILSSSAYLILDVNAG